MNLEHEPFRSMVRASGLGEVWTHSHDDLKFRQFGWRCTNTESCFKNPTLIGNWNEERFDVSKQSKAKRLPSQHEHYFESTYGSSYNYVPNKVPEELKHLKARHPHGHPGHQPELDPEALKYIYNSWETTTRSAYVDPRIRTAPLTVPEGGIPEAETIPDHMKKTS